MTTIAIGGFSTHNDSIGFFKSSNIEIVASIFIILGSIPFISYLNRSRNKKVFKDVQIKGLIYLLLISVVIMFFIYYLLIMKVVYSIKLELPHLMLFQSYLEQVM